MSNPLNTPENRRAIHELRRTLGQPSTGYNRWLQMILGTKRFQNIVELQYPSGHLVPDRIYRLNIADPAHDDR